MSVLSPEQQDLPASVYREIILDRIGLYLLDKGPTKRCEFIRAFSDVSSEDLDRYLNTLERQGRLVKYKSSGRWVLALSEDEKAELSSPYRRVTPEQQRQLLSIIWGSDKLLHKSQENSRRRAKEIPANAVTINPDNSCDIRGDHGTYHTTLTSCTCDDFFMNKKSAAPCKHIYRLASELLGRQLITIPDSCEEGIPVQPAPQA